MTMDENKDIQKQVSELRKFSIIMTVFLALFGGLFLWRGRSFYWCFFVLSLLFAGCGLIRPAILGPVYTAWMKMSHIIGGIMSRLILLILFYLVMTPTALLLRLFGKHFLDIGFTKSSAESYWIPKQADESQERDYERQF
jgi:hypothetical protein